jgi:hypothetical protein
MFSMSNKRGNLAALALTGFGYPLLVRGERYQNAAGSQVNVTFLKEYAPVESRRRLLVLA